jgi:hypothetical protein
MGKEATKLWETVFCLTDTGRRVVSSLTGADLAKVPKVSLDIRTRHVVAVNGVLDALGWEDAWTEVPLGKELIADALAPCKGGYVAVEVDRSATPIVEKVQRYKEKPHRLLVVTHRPAPWERACAGLPKPALVIAFDQLQQQHTLDWLRKELA